jgi:hypothetical protein
MFQEPLERYLANKILTDGRIAVKRVYIRRVDTHDPNGCNWDLDRIEPELPISVMQGIVRSIVRQVRASISVTD